MRHRAGPAFFTRPSRVAPLIAAACFLAWPDAASAHTPVETRAACEREASGRGFAVLDAGDARDHRDGWSLGMRLRALRGEVSTGTCFVDRTSGNVSLYGFGWGDSSERPVDYLFSCASIDGNRHECMVPPGAQARMVERYSSAQCEEGTGWGQRDGRLWVDKGCRAKFAVSFGSEQRAAAADPRQEGTEIVCRSPGPYQECALGAGYTARLVEDLSGRCEDEADWGAREGLLWVNNGCQGRFERVRVAAPLGQQDAQRADADPSPGTTSPLRPRAQPQAPDASVLPGPPASTTPPPEPPPAPAQ
jgi:hypothetical protein